jgi:hypothetical protein
VTRKKQALMLPGSFQLFLTSFLSHVGITSVVTIMHLSRVELADAQDRP